MKTPDLDIPEPVRLRALFEGEPGRAWLARLPEVVAGLASDWGLSLGPALSGGTDAFVAPAVLADGREAVLKVSAPGRDPEAHELETLLAAGGRGYAEVYRHDAARAAILLERLGPQLAELDLSTDQQIVRLCAALRAAWMAPPAGIAFTDGAQKAENLADFIAATWRRLGQPCRERVVEIALGYAEARRAAFDPEQAVLAHGDAHAWNALQVPGGDGTVFKFVDPDGLFIEPAYDLGISMREWTDELVAGDAFALGLARRDRLAELTGVDATAIWQWGFIERVSTGLHAMEIGLDGAAEMLVVAEAWAEGLDA